MTTLSCLDLHSSPSMTPDVSPKRGRFRSLTPIRWREKMTRITSDLRGRSSFCASPAGTYFCRNFQRAYMTRFSQGSCSSVPSSNVMAPMPLGRHGIAPATPRGIDRAPICVQASANRSCTSDTASREFPFARHANCLPAFYGHYGVMCACRHRLAMSIFWSETRARHGISAKKIANESPRSHRRRSMCSALMRPANSDDEANITLM